MSKCKIFLFLLIITITILGIDGRSLRKRRQTWPFILAPGGNTFAASGYYGMQTNIAYPESGIGYNSNYQPWNPYQQGYYQQNQFNNYNPYGYNPSYPYMNNQNIPYGGPGINNGVPYYDQGNYNGYYPPVNPNIVYPPGRSVGGLLPPGVMNSRTGANMGQLSQVERINKPPLSSNT
ncbi:unnamed protein product [Adineta steineri]|uniref:Uncharacterized protein n=1 Tax=Adineta steineri TaxID=433720 RepID=A0A814D1Z3_9BILA|nr:unnamed protein product [Adineta steineri]CAF0947741.1 unnamed protein product [Adineta steineri]CAF3986579.1 unnamed protein product [Adineta steineri]CAF4016960.1 unnamed protein product [Adineta steineri]